jgi:iron(III) transport system permease protein
MANSAAAGASAWRWDAEHLLLAWLVLFVATISIAPMARLLFESVAPAGSLDTSVLQEVLGSRSTWRATLRSLESGVGGTVVSLLLGSAFALLVALTNIRGKRLLVFCFLIPLMIPPQVTALSWIQVFGPSSALLNALGIAPPLGTPNPMYSREGIILLLGIQHAPLVFLALRAGLRSMPREMVEAARAAGAGHWRVLFSVVLPLATPALVAATALAFVSAIGNFGIPALLGLPVNYTVLPTLIYQRLAGFGPDIISEVAVLSILVGVIAFAGVLIQNWMSRRRDYRILGVPSQPLVLDLGRWRPVAEAGCWLVIVLILVLPVTALLATSLVSAYGVPLSLTSMTFDNYVEVMFRQSVTIRAFSNSFLLAGGAALVLVAVTVPLAYFIVWRNYPVLRVLNLAAELPYALPGVVLAIACILLFLKPIPVVGVSIYGTVWIILIAYLARFLTLALRPVIGGFQQLDRHLEEAAQMAGAKFLFRVRTVLLPMVAPVAAAGAILVFLTAFNELTVSALLWSSGSETLGVVVFSLDDGGYTVLATAVAMVTVLVIVALMLAGSLIARRMPPGVLPWEA